MRCDVSPVDEGQGWVHQTESGRGEKEGCREHVDHRREEEGSGGESCRAQCALYSMEGPALVLALSPLRGTIECTAGLGGEVLLCNTNTHEDKDTHTHCFLAVDVRHTRLHTVPLARSSR